MIELKPIRETPEEYDAIEKKITDLFRSEIYLPLIQQFYLNGKALKNSKQDLVEALNSGQLTFNRGKFSGKLNATLTKELRALGATWDRGLKCYSISLRDLPMDIRGAISSSSFKFQEKLESIDRKLADIIPEKLADKLKISHIFDRTIFKVESQFKDSVKNIVISPKLSPEESKKISDEWQNNMKIYIKNFTEEQIQKLRADMRVSVLAGNRYESAIKTIQESYGVTANKAKFLARQETGLLMAKFTETRYQSAGINEYKWRCVVGTPNHPTRPRHKALNDASLKGKVFRFDDPPVTSEPGEPERRNNPKQDYNCRCSAIPIVKFKK